MAAPEAFVSQRIEVVAPNVTQVTIGTSEWTHQTPNFFLLTHGDNAVVVDSGSGTEFEFGAFLEAWRINGKPKVNNLVLTHHHFDHKNGSQRLAELLGVDIIGGNYEPQGMRELTVGTETILVLPTPGHTTDSVCIVDPTTNGVFTGDTIVAEPSSIVEDMSAYFRTLKELQERAPEIIFPGHGNTVYDAGVKIQRYIDRAKKREVHVIKFLMEGADTISMLTRRTYPQGSGEMETKQITAHVQKLVDDGVVIENEGKIELNLGAQWF